MSHTLIPGPAGRDERPDPCSGRRVYIETYGCQMNVYDSQVIMGLLGDIGMVRVDDHLQADVVLLNTCSVRDHAEHRVISRVGELRHLRDQAGLPPAVTGICGCMAERMSAELTHPKYHLDLVVGVDRYDDLPRLIAERLPDLDAAPHRASLAVGHDADIHYVAPVDLYPTNNSHLVTIHKGCDYRCTYCIVPYTRGPQSEKDPGVILDEIRTIVERGGSEVTLLGQNVSAYRWHDGDLDFADLLEQVVRIDGLERIRFLTGHPCDMHEHLMDVIGAEDKICPWLHLPPQSGSDRVLRRMKRRYKRDDYLAMVAYARRVIPDVSFSGDFIVGFPGETDADFEETLSLLRAVRYDAIFSFKYSERPGVPAARLDDDVTLDQKKQRLAALMETQSTIWRDIADAQVGKIWQAVVEEPARKQAGHWRLRTPNNRKVIAAMDGPQPGRIVTVRIDGWRNSAFLGTVV